MAPDWADGLPYEITASIFERMETFDLARCACVCTSWLFVAKQANPRRRHRPPLPWVMLPPARDGSQGNGSCTFFGLPSAGVDNRRMRTCSIRLPEFIWRSCIGSSPDGWLVVLGKNRELCVVNPLTGVRLALPRLVTIPDIALKLRFSPTPMEYSIFIFHYFAKAIVFELPPHGLMVAAVVNRHFHWLVVAKVGAPAWTAMPKPFPTYDEDQVEDIVLHGSTVYGVTRYGRLLACDLANLSVPTVPTTVYEVLGRPATRLRQQLVTFLRPPPSSSSSSSSSSRTSLLVVYRYRQPAGPGNGGEVIHLMRLEQVDEVAFRCVNDVFDLGGHNIFMDDNCCCVAIPAADGKCDNIYHTLLVQRVCRLDALNLRVRKLVGSHRFANVERNNQPTSIWFWPAPKF